MLGLKEKNKIKFICLGCYLFFVVLLQFLAIAYLLGYFNLKPIEKFLNKCGENYYFSKIIIEKDNYYFDDVSACDKRVRNKFTCVYSIKESGINSFYNQKHYLDSNSYNYLNNLKHTAVYNYSNMSRFNDFDSINKLLNSTLARIQMVWFKPTFSNGKIDSIFLITTSKNNKDCNSKAMEILDNY